MNNIIKPKISVVMSVYNGGEFLREAIDSILDQTYTQFEFIIVDDGSTDNSINVIESYKDPRIVLIRQVNKGLVVALNVGLRKAQGKYIARMDADDISIKNRLEIQLRFMESNPELEPNTENHGVHAWAGTIKQSLEISRHNFTISFTSKPNMGRPSDAMFPLSANFLFIFSTVSKSGAKIRVCILLPLPFLEYILLTSVVRIKFMPLY